MARSALTGGQVLSLLEETPPRIAAATAGLTAAELRTAPSPDAWSATDVLAHLRACADVWGGCMAAIIASDRPTLRAVNPRTWIKRTDYRELAYADSWAAFTRQRGALLEKVRPAPAEVWLRCATVTGAGAPLQRTLITYGTWLARHEAHHVQQFERIVSALRRR